MQSVFGLHAVCGIAEVTVRWKAERRIFAIRGLCIFAIHVLCAAVSHADDAIKE